MAKPTLYIPGLPGSDLLRGGRKVFLRVPESFEQPALGLLRGPDDLTAVDPVTAGLPVAEIRGSGIFSILAFFTDLKRAESLYDILRDYYPAGEFIDRCRRFGWDWRRPVWDLRTRDAFSTALIEHRQRHGKVVIIAHSTGGLVLRHLLEDATNPRRDEVLDAIDRIIAFGVPWAGLLKTFKTISGQEGLAPLLGPAEAQEVLARSWASFDLMPPPPAASAPSLPALVTRNGQHTSPLADRAWHPPAGALRDAMVLRSDETLTNWGSRSPVIDDGGRQIPITNVVGWGFDTTTSAELSAGGGVDFRESDDGDNTVPRASAAWLSSPNVETFHVPIGRGDGRRAYKHIVLWGNDGGRSLLAHHVNGEALEAFVYATVDFSDVGDGGPEVRVRYVALAADGSPLASPSVSFRTPSARPRELFAGNLAGRHTSVIPRSSLRTVSASLRRLELDVEWQEGGQPRNKTFGFFVAR